MFGNDRLFLDSCKKSHGGENAKIARAMGLVLRPALHQRDRHKGSTLGVQVVGWAGTSYGCKCTWLAVDSTKVEEEGADMLLRR